MRANVPLFFFLLVNTTSWRTQNTHAHDPEADSLLLGQTRAVIVGGGGCASECGSQQNTRAFGLSGAATATYAVPWCGRCAAVSEIDDDDDDGGHNSN